MKTLFLSTLAIALFLGVAAGTSQASLIGGFPASGTPDITAGNTTVTFTTTGTTNFTVTGYPSSIDFDGIAPPDYNITGLAKSYTLSGHMTTAGILSSVSINITGTVNSANYLGVTTPAPLSSSLTGTLLSSSTLSGFGFNPTSGGQFELEFTNLSGAAASYYGSTLYVNVSSTGFPGTWLSNFTSTGVGTDNYAPEPMTAAMMLAGLPILWLRRRARNRAARRTTAGGAEPAEQGKIV